MTAMAGAGRGVRHTFPIREGNGRPLRGPTVEDRRCDSAARYSQHCTIDAPDMSRPSRLHRMRRISQPTTCRRPMPSLRREFFFQFGEFYVNRVKHGPRQHE